MPSSISTVRWVGVPSSSIDSEPRRASMVPSSTTVTPGAATRSPKSPAKADGFMQQDAGPTRSQHHRHLAGGGGDGSEIDQRLAQRFVDCALPIGRVEI